MKKSGIMDNDVSYLGAKVKTKYRVIPGRSMRWPLLGILLTQCRPSGSSWGGEMEN